MVKSFSNYVLVPFVVFVVVLVAWLTIGLVFGVTAIFAGVLKSFVVWLATGLPTTVIETFSDPWKIAAFPIAIGAVTAFYYWLFNSSSSSSSPVMRGRELADSSTKRGRRPWESH